MLSIIRPSLLEDTFLSAHLTSIDMHLSCLLSLLLFSSAWANVEKTIFIAPPSISIPAAHPNLDDLSLIPLSPLHLSARTRLNASFPTAEFPRGSEHWLLLDGLSPGARYEVRICWLATVCVCTLSSYEQDQLILDSNQPLSRCKL
jgi:hypothetical protein